MLQKAVILLTSILLFLGCGDNGTSTTVELTATSTSSKTGYATKNTSASTEISFVKTIGIHGTALDIALSDDGNFAYIASGDFGLQVLDISDPRHPKLINVLDTFGYVNHVEVANNTAYVSYIPQTWENYESVNAFDISNPYNPAYIGYYEGYANNDHQMDESESHIFYLADSVFYAVSKSDAQNYDQYRLYDPYAFARHNNYIFVANGRDGITVLQVGGSVVSKLVTL